MGTSVIQKQIMRRVYYSYAISLGTHPMLWSGVFLGAAAVLLAKWLHVASIFHNFMAVPVGAAPQFVANSFLHAAQNGELMTVVLVIATGVIALMSGFRLLRQFRWPGLSMQTA